MHNSKLLSEGTLKGYLEENCYRLSIFEKIEVEVKKIGSNVKDDVIKRISLLTEMIFFKQATPRGQRVQVLTHHGGQ